MRKSKKQQKLKESHKTKNVLIIKTIFTAQNKITYIVQSKSWFTLLISFSFQIINSTTYG